MDNSRRIFLKNSVTFAAGVSLFSMMPGMTGCSANDKITVGLIGCKGMGFNNLKRFMEQPDVEVLALCDVDHNILMERANDYMRIQKALCEKRGISTKNIRKPKLYKDFRKLIEDKDIDAVIIGTPDHWHCLPMTYACEEGKAVYVEKPLGNTIGECMVMEQAANRYNTVVQVGQWQRSGKHWQDAIDYVNSGALGKISKVKTWAFLDWLKPTVKANQPVPEGVDYNFWLGPAPERDFNPNRFHFHFRWWWDYAGGLMTDWGVHLLDFALYGMNAGMPKSIKAEGGNFIIDPAAMETPDTLKTIYEYDDFEIEWQHAVGKSKGPYDRDHGVAFIGEKATLIVDRGGWEVIVENEEGNKISEVIPRTKTNNNAPQDHARDFLDCMKTKEKPKASVKIGKTVAMVAHMGNIAYLSGEKLYWDAQNNEFVNNAKANERIWPTYRKPWVLPKY